LSQINKRTPTVHQFACHTSSVHDVAFSPFYSTIFATASEDLHVKIWEVPSTHSPSVKQDATASLKGHEKRVSFCCLNPVADWVMATGSADSTVRIWNLETQSQAACLKLQDALLSVKWNESGALIATTCKDKTLRILDPRLQGTTLKTDTHEGTKAAKCEWLNGLCGAPHLVVTAGFTKKATREFALFDIRNIKQPTMREDMDKGTGIVNPFF